MESPTVELSVVIPVYRSAECLAELLRQLTGQLETLGREYEIVLVDDDSPDESWRVIRNLAVDYPMLSAIRLMRNGGQARATLCGMEHARGRIIVTMDDDLQHRPDQLPKLLDALDADPEVDCVMARFREKKHALYRNVGSRVIRWINGRAFGLPRDLRPSAFRAMRRSVAEAILSHQTRNPAIAALISGSTRRIVNVDVEHADRYAGRSNYTLAKQFRLALDHICNVSMLPLHLVSFLGLAICLLAAVLVAVVLVRYFLGEIGVPGWTTVVILVSFFSGITLLALGIIGEYMARILREVRGSPPYVERERITGAKAPPLAEREPTRGEPAPR